MRAFGLEFVGDADLGLPTAPLGGSGRGRSRLRRVQADAIMAVWPADAEPVRQMTAPDGSVMLRVDHHPDVGYLLVAPGHGCALVAPDSSTILCAPEPGGQWDYLLSAQVLPLAAAAAGHEVLHASAVASARGAAILCAASGTGKTSIAARLVLEGFALMADDAVALEPVPAGVLVHPSIPEMHLREPEAALLSEAERAQLGGTGDRRLDRTTFMPRSAAAPLALAAVFILRRVPEGSVDLVDTVDPAPLLASTFHIGLRSPARLIRHLSLCARIATEVPMQVLLIPPSASAADAAAVLVERLGRT